MWFKKKKKKLVHLRLLKRRLEVNSYFASKCLFMAICVAECLSVSLVFFIAIGSKMDQLSNFKFLQKSKNMNNIKTIPWCTPPLFFLFHTLFLLIFQLLLILIALKFFSDYSPEGNESGRNFFFGCLSVVFRQ